MSKAESRGIAIDASPDEGTLDMLVAVFHFGLSVATLGLVLAGGYFVWSALSMVINPIYSGSDPGQIGSMLVLTAPVKSANAALGAAMLLGALVLLVFQIGTGINRRLDHQNELRERHIELAMQQVGYSRYLVGQARKASKGES